MRAVALEESWRDLLEGEFEQPYMKELKSFLVSELSAGKTIYPHGKEILQAFDWTPFEQVKVVIIGQDPYHAPDQAHGACFSVKPGVPAPPSLVNIFKEIHADLGLSIPNHGYLEKWGTQGVFLLNTVLTVERGRPASHQGRGWERFTDRVVELLNREREGLVFMLWGSHASKKAEGVDSQRHLVLRAPHPSPLSAHRGFLGCGHFGRANHYLVQCGLEPIDWSLE